MMETQGPISFSAWSMARILARAKTNTRRPIKDAIVRDNVLGKEWSAAIVERDGDIWLAKLAGKNPFVWEFRSPYRVGDLRWCREPWRVEASQDSYSPSEFDQHYPVDYRAPSDGWMHSAFAGRWRSGRYMPRWASRAVVEIDGVRAERVQGIGFDDVLAEGVQIGYTQYNGKPFNEIDCSLSPLAWRDDFRHIWASHYGHKSPYRWELNCWVWVYGFRLVESAL